jgi:uncharacterized protein (TIGR02246 family)
LIALALVTAQSLLAPQGFRAAEASQISSDEKAVRDLVQRYVDARDKRDAKALAALFTADADQFTTSGEWRRGRDAIVAGGLASSQRNPGARTIAVETVRFITPDIALADGGYTIAGGEAARPMWTTILARRDGSGWRIAAIRNALPTGNR